MLAFIIPACLWLKTFRYEYYAAWIELLYNKVIPLPSPKKEDSTDNIDKNKIVPERRNTEIIMEPNVEFEGESASVSSSGASNKTFPEKIMALEPFFVAVLMLAFGVVALVAGLVSIFDT